MGKRRQSRRAAAQTEETFEVTFLGRIKHTAIRKALKRLGWTQKQGAKFIGIGYQTFCQIANLRQIPDPSTMAHAQAWLWQKLTGERVTELWPPWMREALKNVPKEIEVTREITPFMLETSGLLALEMAPDEILEQQELAVAINSALEKITPRQGQILRQRYEDGKTRGEISDELGCTPQNVNVIEASAFRSLRRPRIAKKLKPFLYSR